MLLNDSYAAWLKNLKVGDEVAVMGGTAKDHVFIGKITHMTPTGLVDVKFQSTNVTRFNSDGTRRGLGYYRIIEATDDVRRRIARNEAADYLEKFPWRSLSIEQMIEVMGIINQNGCKEVTK